MKHAQIFKRNYEPGRQEVKEYTVISRLRRYKKRNVRPSQQDMQDVTEYSDIFIERVYELAKEDQVPI